MRPETLALLFLLFPLSTAQASLLPQLEKARQVRDLLELTALPATKHYVEVEPGVVQAVKGERERRQVRFARWLDQLEGDRLAVYQAEGFPPHRHFESEAGRRTEIWSYPERGLSYVFRGRGLWETRIN